MVPSGCQGQLRQHQRARETHGVLDVHSFQFHHTHALAIIGSIISLMTRFDGVGFLFMIPYILYSPAVFIRSLAVSVRWVHDIGRRGWWLLINLVPFIGGIWSLVLTILDSHPGNNAYGPWPKTGPVFGAARSTEVYKELPGEASSSKKCCFPGGAFRHGSPNEPEQ